MTDKQTTEPSPSPSATCSAWLDAHDADDSCGVLRLHAKDLKPIVVARCAKRPRKALLKHDRECDPCVCGYAGGWHTECYWWFSRHTNQPATETFALPWRLKMSLPNEKSPDAGATQ